MQPTINQVRARSVDKAGGCDILGGPDPVVPAFRISSRTLGAVEIDASNWLVALGEGLARLGTVDDLERIACEVLPNGTILVRDVRRGVGYVVQPLTSASPSPTEVTEDTEQVVPEPETSEVPVQAPRDRVGRWVDAIRAAVDTRQALRLTLEGATVLAPAEGGAILLEQANGGLLFSIAYGPQAPKLKNLVLPAGTGVAGFCVDHAVALTVNEAYQDPRFYAEVDRHTGASTRSILAVPIAQIDRVFGCVELINAADPRGFPASVLTEVGALADALAERLAARD